MKSARLIAQTSGAKLGKVLSIAEGHSVEPMPNMALAMRAEADNSVPIAAGEGTMHATVSIIFELE